MRGVVTTLLLFIILKGFGQVDSSFVEDMLDQVVITAQFVPTDTRQTVNSVKILNRKTIEQRSLVSIQELLQTESNLRVTQDPILGSVLSINGLKGENLKVLIDGVPIVGRLNGNIDAGQIPLNAIQKVEIIEGAQSLLYGSDATGGVVNIITKRSQLKKIESEVTGQYENNGFRQVTAGLGYSTEKWVVQANGNIQDFRPAADTTMGRDQLWNPKDQRSARGMVRFMPDDRTDLRVSASVLTEQVDNLGDLKRPQFRPYAFDDYYNTDRFDMNFHGERWTSQRDLIQATIGWNTFERIKNSYKHDFDTGIDEPLATLQDSSATRGLLTRFTYASERPGNDWSFLFGLENYYQIASGTRLVDSTLTTSGNKTSSDFGLFASAKWKILSQLTAQTGTRWTVNNNYGSALTPSTWLLWKPKKPLEVRFSWAYGYRSPDIKELYFSFIDVNHFVTGNPNLNPEKSLNLRGEVAWKTYNNHRWHIKTTFNGFYNNMQDRISLIALGPVHYEYRNVEEFITVGGGVKLEVGFLDKVKFRTEAVSTGFSNTNDDVTVEKGVLLWSMDWTNDLTVSFLNDKLQWSIWHKRTGDTPYFYNQDGKTLQGKLDTWNMLNTGISTQILNNKLRLNVGVKNILNIRQLQINNINGIHIEASNQNSLHWGRDFYIGVAYKI